MLRHLTSCAAVAAALVIAAPDMIAAPAHAAVGFDIEIGPDRPPPRLRVERRPPRPRPDWAWRAGRWDFRNGEYIWIDGEWVAPPSRRAVWEPGHWEVRRRRYFWVEGHWR